MREKRSAQSREQEESDHPKVVQATYWRGKTILLYGIHFWLGAAN